ncbi:MAG: hypothetical protein GWO20_01780 [Candidatus Korarchaeota archaeon]|nr:hypothetical protein [Candidatus Korarchaeota archaeon]NIU82253.1 hypothetical protein [Candidatus Thorarchaeota archaeon]NIW12704.1 hypothetical protein [Candidatus Thorarchaeota archaeon]NIW50917.1 hypothetical protein [Candidatus Korarchaeota archaeon]
MSLKVIGQGIATAGSLELFRLLVCWRILIGVGCGVLGSLLWFYGDIIITQAEKIESKLKEPS